MSKIGAKPIKIPNGVTITQSGNLFVVQGPKGKIEKSLINVTMEIKEEQLHLTPNNNITKPSMFWGTASSIIRGMIEGVTNGFIKELNIVGVGYKAAVAGKNLNLALGFSHPVNLPIPTGITVETPKPTIIIIKGIDKEQVGQFAALIRSYKMPEPYLGKGILYKDEKIIRKAGKAAGK
ncbi:hypothetical protein ASO20_01910 [Mycoplasma sp. (ex Biomphalaria glabrata)]|uniref:50S ribosomal protein L6 n=1 Tax=Mycoplasma sp. (ex Biomphalaria glabrata) TaxID=1749074 RepID=UPI00073A772A|nr:50S ribosomal protein L6 [Mycoplasma sp. (ex Biomphalaria glabrata)]ALV23401.1 hypothetical protein ASO20_01910 [Mycoplasma sp. (ex Biomphalaria glabrata)]